MVQLLAVTENKSRMIIPALIQKKREKKTLLI